jgi:2-C-methyl-D-erythritol 4-phosphate cytidylyltransferase
MARTAVPLRGRGRRPFDQGRAAVVVLGGGSGTRLGAGTNKVYLPLAGRRVISWSLQWAAQVPQVGAFVLVVRPEDVPLAEEVLHREARGLDVRMVVGGATRHESEDAALVHLAPYVEAGEIDVIALHDGARPLAGPALFRSVVTTAEAVGGAVPALPATGILPVGPDGSPHPGGPAGLGPERLTRVQTPQAFRAKDLLAAYSDALRGGFQGTDTASTVERFSDLVVQTVAGSRTNLKVTYPHDLFLAEQLLAAHRYRLP